MTWFKVDDGFYRNAKTAMLSDAATALWLRAATWACDQLTDGFVPARILPMLRGCEDSVNELVESGLWELDDAGYVFHDWLNYQPSADEVEDLRQKRSNAGRRGARITNRKKSVGKTPANAAASDAASDAANARQISGNMLGKKAANLRPVSVPVPVVTSNEVTPSIAPQGANEPTDSDEPIPVQDDYPLDFVQFWSVYPRKQGKLDASRAFAVAKRKKRPVYLVAQAQRYASDPNREERFTLSPAKWLNGEHWDDAPEPARSGVGKAATRLRNHLDVARNLRGDNQQPMRLGA